MQSTFRVGALTLTVLSLAACGGSGDVTILPTPPADVDDPVATATSFADLENSFLALDAAIPSAAADPSDVPTSGTATFTGFFSGELDPDAATTDTDIANGDVDFIAGDAQIQIDFGNDNETIGAAGNFQSDTVDSIEGTVVLFDFETTRGTSAVVFVGNYVGNLTITDDDYASGEQTVAGQFGGGYFGDDGQYVNAITEPVDGFNDIYFDGDIIAERD